MKRTTMLRMTVTSVVLAASLTGCPEFNADGGSGPCETTPPSARLVAVPTLPGVHREGTVALTILRDPGNPCALEEDIFGDVDCECAEDQPERRAPFEIIRADCVFCKELSVGPFEPITNQVVLRVVPESPSLQIDIEARTSDGLVVSEQLWLEAPIE